MSGLTQPENAAARRPDSSSLMSDEKRLVLTVVGGPQPYLSISDAQGNFIDTVMWADLRETFKGVRGGR